MFQGLRCPEVRCCRRRASQEDELGPLGRRRQAADPLRGGPLVPGWRPSGPKDTLRAVGKHLSLRVQVGQGETNSFYEIPIITQDPDQQFVSKLSIIHKSSISLKSVKTFWEEEYNCIKYVSSKFLSLIHD